MIRRLSLILVAFILGLIYETRFWGKPLDVAFPFFIIICLVLWFIVMLVFNTELLPSRRSLWLFIPPVFFATTALMNAQNPTSLKYKLSFAFIFLYLGLLSMTYLGGQLDRYCLFDYLQNIYRLIRTILLQPVQFIGQVVRDLFFPDQDRPAEVVISARYGNCISILIIVALFGLFWWVDGVFRQFHITLYHLLFPDNPDGQTNIWRIILWSYLILGIFLYAAMQSRDEHLIANNEQAFIRWFTYGRSLQVFVAPMIPLITFSVLRIHSYINPGEYLDEKSGFPYLPEPNAYWAFAVASGLIFLLILWLNHVTVFDGERDRIAHTVLNFVLFIGVSFLVGAAILSVSIYTAGIHAPRQVWYARGGIGWLWLMFGMFIGYEFFHNEPDYLFAALRVTTVLVGAFCFFGTLLTTL